MAEISMDIEPPIPSMDPSQLSQPQDEAGPSNTPEFYQTLVFTETPVSQPTPPSPTTTCIVNVDGSVTTQMLAMGTLASGAGSPPSPCFFPSGEKLAKKKGLPENADLSMFDILNIFWHCWFLSLDHLRAQALSAQKAKDGKFFWVEFTPQFHTHLVKYIVVLVPWPIQKVKKVMFGFILELLNEEGPTTFFDLTKGQRCASQAQKEKKHLACKRNHALRHDHQKVAKEAVEGHPQW
jgi:hypothetical protein